MGEGHGRAGVGLISDRPETGVVMKDVTARVPPELVTEMDSFVEDSVVYTSRAEFVRHAIREKLDREAEE